MEIMRIKLREFKMKYDIKLNDVHHAANARTFYWNSLGIKPLRERERERERVRSFTYTERLNAYKC